MSCSVVITRSGAKAVLDSEVGEVMHPVVGPLVEAPRLYVNPSRLKERLRSEGSPLVLLDVGLGAASNAITAWWISEQLSTNDRRLEIVSLDRTLEALQAALTAPDDFLLQGEAGIAARALLERGVHETARTSWRYIEGELPGLLDTLPAGYDVVYWDMYSASDNPTLWSVSAFRSLRRLCRQGCTVHTYSGATAIRSALLLAGFSVGLGPAIDEKKHGTTATVGASLDSPLDARWLQRLTRSSAPLPADAPPDALQIISSAAQFQL